MGGTERPWGKCPDPPATSSHGRVQAT